MISLLFVALMVGTVPTYGSGDEDRIGPVSPTRTDSFINVSSDVGLDGVKGDNLAWGDFNNDGYLDLLVRGPISNHLYKNSGPPNWSFIDVSNETGVNTTRGYCQWADYNGDGNLDFYSAYIEDHLFRNNGPPDWDFTDVTIQAGRPSDDLQSEGIAWGDYDRDGYPDIFTVGWRKPGDLQWPYAGEMDRLYHNNGDGTFSDVSLAAGLRPRETSYAGMGVVWCDPNEDGWSDIYVSNYHLNPNQLWINNRDGTFTDMAFEYNLTGKATEYQGTTYYGHSNGAGWADIDNDRDMDLFVSHLAHKDDERSGMNRGYYCADSQLFLNSGAPYLEFTDIREEAGIPITPSGTIVQDPDSGNMMWKDEDYFGVAWGDMDNDGDVDLWVPQVKTYSFWDHSFLWRNDGDLKFVDRTDGSGLKVWSNTGGTWVDFDNDGDLDLCTEGTYPFRGPREIHLFQNPGSSDHWIELDLNGAGGPHQTSTDATGTKVTVFADNRSHTRYVGGDCGGHGFQQPQRLHFGLGPATVIDEMWIYWTSGRIQKISDVSVDQILTLNEPTDPWVELSGPEHFDVLEDEPINITITSTGANIVSHLWDHDADGWDHGTARPELPVTSTEQGKRWVRYRAKDEYGTFWDLEPIIIDVSNVRPTIHPQGSFVVNESELAWIEMDLQETPSDIDSLDFYIMAHGAEEWEWIGDGDIVQYSLIYDEMGEYKVQFKVVDDDGAEDQKDITINVINKKPEVILSCKLYIDEGDLLLLNAQATDTKLDEDELQYRFHAGDGRSTSWQSSDDFSFKYTKNGTYTIAVEVKDRHGDIGSDRMDLIVKNRIPELALKMEEGPLNVDEDEEITFEVTISDTDNDVSDLEVQWDFGDGSDIQRWGASTRAKYTFEEQGEYTVTISVRDDDEAISSVNKTVIVKNVPPVIYLTGPSGGEVNEDQGFTVTGLIEDTASDEEFLEYRWNMGDGNITEWRSGDPYIQHFYEISGPYQVILWVRDDDGEFNGSTTIDVRNIPPKADLSSSTRNVDKDSTIRFDAASSEDTASDRGNLMFMWDLGDGHIYESGPKVTHIYRTGGIFNVKVSVIDDDLEEDTESLLISVIDLAPLIDMDVPERAQVGDSIVFDGSGSYDTETDLPNLTYSFDPGDGTGILPSNGSIVTHVYQLPGEFEVTMEVSDGTNTETTTSKIIILTGDGADNGNSGSFAILLMILMITILVIVIVTGLLLFIRKKNAPPPRVQPPMGPPPRPRMGPAQLPAARNIKPITRAPSVSRTPPPPVPPIAVQGPQDPLK